MHAKYKAAQPANRSARPAVGAQILGVGLSTFWRYSTRPDFPAARKLSSRCTVYDVDELIAWRDAQGATAGNGSKRVAEVA